MINDNTILSSFNDRPTLLEWLKKVEEALKSDTAKSISVENPETNVYIIKITFADGRTMYSEPVKLPDSVKSVAISNNHLIITTQGGIREDLGVINPYAETIVINAETNTTEIGGNLQVNGSITASGKELTAVVANPTEETTETLSKLKIGNTAYAVGGGGTQWYKHNITFTGAYDSSCAITFLSLRQDTLKDGVWNPANYPIILTSFEGPSGPNVSTSFPSLFVASPSTFLIYYIKNNEITNFTLEKTSITSEEVTAL